MSKTVKVRVLAGVDCNGKTFAMHQREGETFEYLRDCMCDVLTPGERYYWLEAELPIPEPEVVQAEVRET